MRAVCIIVATLATVPVLFGQYHNGGGPGAAPSAPGPAATHAAPPSWAPGLPPSSASGAYHQGSYSHSWRSDRGRRPVIVPYYFPLYYGGYGYGGYGYDAYSGGQPPSVMNNDYPPQQAPQVVINQTFVNGTPVSPETQPDSFRTYQAPTASSGYGPDFAPPAPAVSAPVNDPLYYLIAYKDHTIFTALAYWMEGSTFHYVTTQNAHNQASIDLLDLDFTTRLNQERNVSFSLPMSH